MRHGGNMRKVRPEKYDITKTYAVKANFNMHKSFKPAFKNCTNPTDNVGVLTPRVDGDNGKIVGFTIGAFTGGYKSSVRFEDFADFLETMRDKNITVHIFDTNSEFVAWLVNVHKRKFEENIEDIADQLIKDCPELIADILGKTKKWKAPPVEYAATTKHYGCDECGWVYNDTITNESFEQLGENFVCPECGADKVQFSKLKMEK